MQQMKVNEGWKHMFLVADNGVNSLSGKDEIDDELYDDDNNDNNNNNNGFDCCYCYCIVFFACFQRNTIGYMRKQLF